MNLRVNEVNPPHRREQAVLGQHLLLNSIVTTRNTQHQIFRLVRLSIAMTAEAVTTNPPPAPDLQAGEAIHRNNR